MVRVVPRKFEAVVGGALIKLTKDKALKDAKLEPKSVFLPKAGIPIHYLERGPVDASLTLLFCHGMSEEAVNMAAFIHVLGIPEDDKNHKNVRILVPDAIGHGRDLERAKDEKSGYQQPTPMELLESTIEFLEVLKVKNCNAFGYSMGGAIVYFLRCKRPDIVQRTVLVSPALDWVLDDQFVDDFVQGRKRHFCFKGRQDVKLMLRDCCPPERNKKDPIPKFFLEAVWDERKRRAPIEHFDAMLRLMLKERGADEGFISTSIDIDKEGSRLVFWPDQDFICSPDKGRVFFQESEQTDFVPIRKCGHMFDTDGAFVLDIVASRVSKYLLTS